MIEEFQGEPHIWPPDVLSDSYTSDRRCFTCPVLARLRLSLHFTSLATTRYIDIFRNSAKNLKNVTSPYNICLFQALKSLNALVPSCERGFRGTMMPRGASLISCRNSSQTGKTTAIRQHSYPRDHQEGSFEVPLDTPQTITALSYWGI